MPALYANLRFSGWNFSARSSLYLAQVFDGLLSFLLLRSLPAPCGPDEILGRFSSSLPPSFAPGRFATFLSPSPPIPQSGCALRRPA